MCLRTSVLLHVYTCALQREVAAFAKVSVRWVACLTEEPALDGSHRESGLEKGLQPQKGLKREGRNPSGE